MRTHLIVDDNRDFAEDLAEILRDADHAERAGAAR
jgi:hypothetical protein